MLFEHLSTGEGSVYLSGGGDCDADGYVHTDVHGYIDADCDVYGYVHANCDVYGHVHADRDVYGYVHANCHVDADCNVDGHVYADSDIHGHADRAAGRGDVDRGRRERQ
jgi:hypothetical protein